MSHGRASRGFTLLELIATVAILGVAGAIALPLMATAADGYSSATRARSATENASFALGTISRLLREVPAGDAGVAIASLDASGFALADGRSVRLEGSTLLLVDAQGVESPLCRHVSAFEVRGIASDGVTAAGVESGLIQRFEIRLTVRGLTLSAVAFPRSLTIGGE